jgi:hypothetical protein
LTSPRVRLQLLDPSGNPVSDSLLEPYDSVNRAQFFALEKINTDSKKPGFSFEKTNFLNKKIIFFIYLLDLN